MCIRPEDALRDGVYGEADGRAKVLRHDFGEATTVHAETPNERRIVPVAHEQVARDRIHDNRAGFLKDRLVEQHRPRVAIGLAHAQLIAVQVVEFFADPVVGEALLVTFQVAYEHFAFNKENKNVTKSGFEIFTILMVLFVNSLLTNIADILG